MDVFSPTDEVDRLPQQRSINSASRIHPAQSSSPDPSRSGRESGRAGRSRAYSAHSFTVSGRGKRCEVLFKQKNVVPARKRPRDIVRCITHDRTPVPGGMEGWTNVKIVDAAYESALTRGVIRV